MNRENALHLNMPNRQLPILSTLADRLRSLREDAAITLGELREFTGMTPSYLYRLERDERANPSLANLEKLCAVYGVTRDWLLAGHAPQFLAPEVAEVAFGAIDEKPDAERALRKFIIDVRVRAAILQRTKDESERTKLAEEIGVLAQRFSTRFKGMKKTSKPRK